MNVHLSMCFLRSKVLFTDQPDAQMH